MMRQKFLNTLLSSLLLFGLVLNSNYAISQTKVEDLLEKNLIFSKKINKDHLFFFDIINSELRIGGSTTTLFLLDKNNLVIDELEISNNRNNNPIQFFEVYNGKILVSSMKKSFRLKIAENKLIVEEKYDYKEINKSHKFIDKVLLFEDLWIGYEYKWNKKDDKTSVYLIDKNNQVTSIHSSCKINKNFSPSEKQFGMVHPVGSETIIFNLFACGKSLVFDLKRKNILKEYDHEGSADEVGFLAQDKKTGAFIRIQLSESKYKIYSLDKDFNDVSILFESLHQPVGFYDSKIHFFYPLDGDIAHSYVPILGDSSDDLDYFNLEGQN